MKNYYEILGVKETASEEEIREKWVKRMREFHPDQRMGGIVEDKKVKDINEAYQILKHSSTRAVYDLKRAYDRKKRKPHIQRVSFLISILAALLIIGTVYLKKPQVTLQAALGTPNQTNRIDKKDRIDQADPIISTNSTNATDQKNEISSKKATHNDAMTKKLKDTRNSMTQKPFDLIDQKDQINDLNVIRITASPNLRISSFTHERIDASMHNHNDPTDVTNDPNDLNGHNDPDSIQIVASTPERIDASPQLIATEEEIKQFLANYIDRYTRKDLEGFLSRFSSRALQNHQDGLEQIRKIYTDYFNQSQEIRYRMEDPKIEIYQNGVEVKARYEVDQILKKGGEKKAWKGHIRLILVKEDGVLKILSLDYQHQKSP